MPLTRRTLLQSIWTPLFTAGTPEAVEVQSDGMLSVSGCRAFLLGLYQLPNRPDPWRLAREAGFQVINLPPATEEFNKAHEHGLYGWTALGSISPQRQAADEARIRKIVTTLKDHPALLFWETEDEPSFTWKKTGPRVPPETIRETYRFVKSLDPRHPLYLNHAPTNLVSTLRLYNPGGDLIATDIYPVIPRGIRELYALWPDGRQGDFLNCHISQVGQYADKMRQVAGPARAVFMVLQAFAWENLREKDRDLKMVFYPAPAELRFMAYQSIVHGANGLLYWGLYSTPPDAPLWEHLASLTRELRRLHDVLSARSVVPPFRCEYHDTGHSLDRGIEWTAKPVPSGLVLIAVNADSNPVDATIAGLANFRSCTALFESRSLPLQQGTIRDSFEPFGVHVYRLLH